MTNPRQTRTLHGFVLQPFLSMVAYYLRHTRFEKGRWRLTQMFLPRLRTVGDQMGERQVMTRHGFRMVVNLGEWIGQHIYMTGNFEPSTAQLLRARLCGGDIAIDVGANIGFFTLVASQQVGPSGKVHAFEPVPSTGAALTKNLNINSAGNVVVHQIALSNRGGMVTIYEGPGRNKGLSSMRRIDDAVAELTVPSAALDHIDLGMKPIRLIKIDVEGAEQLIQTC